MPTPQLEEPTTRVTINLYTRDIEYLKRRNERYQTKVRDIIRRYCHAMQMTDPLNET